MIENLSFEQYFLARSVVFRYFGWVNCTLPIAACMLGLFLASCQKSTKPSAEMEILSNETKIVALSQKIKLLTMRTDKLALAQQEWDAIHEVEKESRLLVTELRNQQTQLVSEIETLQQSIAAAAIDLKNQARLSAKGQSFASLVTKTRTYEEVTITDVNDAGIEIKHKTGSARIVCENLTSEQIEQFGLDPEASRIALQREAQQFSAHETAQAKILNDRKQEEQRLAAMTSLYKPAPMTARVTVPRSVSSYTYSSPRPVYRVVRRNYSSYDRPTYYYYNNSSNYTPSPVIPSYGNGRATCPTLKTPTTPWP